MSASSGEWDDSFDAFASSRLNSPKGSLSQSRSSPASSQTRSYPPINTKSLAQELQACEEGPPPLPPRRLLRNSVNEIYSDGWLHRGQELAVHKEAYLLSQTGVASLQHGREGELKRNSISPDPHTSSETSDSLNVHSQPHRNVTSAGLVLEEKLKKFKYEPLEADAGIWGGMLFEQDLYGRVCQGKYGQPKVKNHLLSLNGGVARGKMASTKLPDSEISVEDLLKLPSETPSKLEGKIEDIKATSLEEEEPDPPEAECYNNNVSFSLTLGDLNMNVNNSDFGFIDSDGSSQSEVLDTLKGIHSFTQLPEDSQIASFQTEPSSTPEEMFTLKDTYIPEMNSSFEIIASSNKLCKVSPVCQDNHQDCQREQNTVASHVNSKCNSVKLQTQASNPPNLDTKSKEDLAESDSTKTQKDIDDNGNLQGTVTLKEPLSGVVSARLRPKGASQLNSPNNRGINNDREFEQLLSLVRNISRASEGPLSYQPTKSALTSLLSFNNNTELQENSTSVEQRNHSGANRRSPVSSKDNTRQQNCEVGNSPTISFEDLHAKVAPKTKIGQSLQDPELSSLSTPCALSLSADAQVTLPPTPVCRPSMHSSSTGPSAGAGTTLAVAPYTTSFSYSTTSTTDQPLVDARHSLLPEETQPASNLPRQESR